MSQQENPNEGNENQSVDSTASSTTTKGPGKRIAIIAVVVGLATLGGVCLLTNNSAEPTAVADSEPASPVAAEAKATPDMPTPPPRPPAAPPEQPEGQYVAPDDAELAFQAGKGRLILSPKGQARVMHDRENYTMISLFKGTIVGAVAANSPKGTYIVRAGRVFSQISGGKFSMTQHGSSYTHVYSPEGNVTVEILGKEQIHLEPGQQLEIKNGQQTVGPVMKIAVDHFNEMMTKL